MNDISIRINDGGVNIDLGHSQSVSFQNGAAVLAGASSASASSQGSAGPRLTASNGIVTDHRTSLQWSQDDVTDKAVSWTKADKACRELRLGGFDDWRMPTREELLTLVDDTRHEPAIDTDAFPGCKSTYYWTSTPWAASPSDCAWIVVFYDGDSYDGGRDDDYRVRAVRGSSRQ